MTETTINYIKISAIFFLFSFFFFISGQVMAITVDYSEEIDKIQKQIDEQQKSIKELKNQEEVYREKIDLKRKEAATLKNQLSILSDQISERELEIKTKEEEIKSANLSIRNIQLKILQKKEEIDLLKNDLKGILQKINQYDQKNYLEIFFANNSFSEILNHSRYLASLQEKLSYSAKRVEVIKSGLEEQEKNLRIKLQELIGLKNDLKSVESRLVTEKQINQTILEETQGAEWKFQSLLAETITEQQEMESDIAFLEKEVRKKISEEKEKQAEAMEAEGNIVFSWPVPLERITCSFHDPDYPYRSWIGEHSGIDLRAAQKTNVRAAASGYVARAKNGGLGYSYIMIIHNDTFSTIYGHLNEISVQEGEYVKRGSVIGKSGGLPGTSGAGNFSTGPHLHFEVRMKGIPVNPEEYLL